MWSSTTAACVGDAAVDIEGCRPAWRPRRPSSAPPSPTRSWRKWQSGWSPAASCPRCSPAATWPAATRSTQAHLRRRRRAMSASPFAVRGVIEGFYGRPWTHAAAPQPHRLPGRPGHEHVRLLAQGRPARPPRVARTLRRRGARPPARAGRALSRQADAFPWCISPGLSIRYSDAADCAALEAKIGSVMALGVGQLRPVPRRHPHRAAAPAGPRGLPRPRRGARGAGQRVFAALPGGTRLIVCPMVYWGSGTEPYLHAGRGHRSAHRAVLDRPRDLLPDAGPGGRRRLRRAPPTGRPPTGTTTRSTTSPWATSCTSGRIAAATRSCGEASTRHHRQRHGAVRGVAHPLRHDRRLPARSRGLRARSQLASCHARRGRRGRRRGVRLVRGQRALLVPDATTTRPSWTRRWTRALFELSTGTRRRAAADLAELADRLLAAAATCCEARSRTAADRREPAVAGGLRDRRAGHPAGGRPGRRGAADTDGAGGADPVPRQASPSARACLRRASK